MAKIVQESYDENAEWASSQRGHAILKQNEEQFSALQKITACVEAAEAAKADSEGGVFFVQGPAGTGKTFLYNTMLSWFRSHCGDADRQKSLGIDGKSLEPRVAPPVAHSAPAAQLLRGGITSHSRFGIKRHNNWEEVVTLNVEEGDGRWHLLRAATLIVWDEAPTSDRRVVDMIDREMRKFRNNDAPFGGCVVVFGGDFQQCPPIGDAGEGAEAGAKYNLQLGNVWKTHIAPKGRLLRLAKSMRQKDDAELFEWLQQIGQGAKRGKHEPSQNNTALLPKDRCQDANGEAHTQETLWQAVYEGVEGVQKNSKADRG